jgi:hypothetical protein
MSGVVGGPSRKRGIGHVKNLVESGVLALVLASCGGGSSPPRLQEPDQGDEAGIRIVVGVRITPDSVRVEPSEVDAFLPLRFRLMNETKRSVTMRITGRPNVQMEAESDASQDVDGGPPRRIVLRAGQGRRAVVRVRSG